MPETAVSQMDYTNVMVQCSTDEKASRYLARQGFATEFFEEGFSVRIVPEGRISGAVNLLGSGWKFPELCHVMEVIKQLTVGTMKCPEGTIATDLRTDGKIDPLTCGPREELCIVTVPGQPVRLVSKKFNDETDAILLVRF